MNEYLRKNILFHADDPEDMELYHKLQTLKHGEFSKTCKELLWDYIRRDEK